MSDVQTRPRSNSDGKKPSVAVERRPRAASQQVLTPRTPRDRALASTHLRLIEKVPTRESDDESSSSAAAASSSSSSTIHDDGTLPSVAVEAGPAYVVVAPNLAQTEIDERLAEADRSKERERMRSATTTPTTRRVQSANFDEQSASSSNEAEQDGPSAFTPRTQDDDEDVDDDDEDEVADADGNQESAAAVRLQAAVLGTGTNGGAPRRLTADVALRHKRQSNIMQAFLNADACTYSFTDLHTCIWNGLNDALREQFWVVQSVPHESTMAPESIDTLLARARLPEPVYKQIMADLYRTLPEAAHANRYFINTLYRGLVAHAVLRPDIGYQQGMNFIWGVVILCVTKPQQQLLVMEHIVRNVLPYYFTTDRIIGAAIDAVVLRYYLHRRCPNLAQLMLRKFDNDLHPMLLRMTSSWFVILFINRFRLSQCKRLIDMVMLRGAVVLFEFTLRLFIYAHKHKWLERASCWPEFMLMVEQRLLAMPSIDPVLRVHLPNERLVHEDFAARRRVATRIVFADLQNDTPYVDAGAH